MEEEKNAAERCLEIIKEGSASVFLPYLHAHASLLGGCDLDKAYTGPKLPQGEDGKYTIDLNFIKEMLEWFKEGKTLPRRPVEFIRAAYTLILRPILQIRLGNCLGSP